MTKSAKMKRTSSKRTSSMTPWIIGAALLFAAIIVLAVTLNGRTSQAPIAPPDIAEEWVNRTRMGNPEAVVTVQAWEDFLCPACRQWTTEVEPQIYEEYVKSGQVILEFRQFPLQVHAPGAQMGALASECAADQGAFWPYHDRLFQVAGSAGQAGFQAERLIGYAVDLGLNENQFNQCLLSQEHRASVDNSVNEAIAGGLNSTPSVVINGQLMPEPFNYNALKAEIDRLLAAAGS